MAGQFAKARELGEAAAQIAEKLGPNRFAAICAQFLGQVELLAGTRRRRAPAALGRWRP